ncbi:EAL domain-containing protein [Heliobacillus mobilis]|uniref:EAL domain-containing protein n=1 Tax=Heliobacterium mobile TaxID=28064 RepID=A0A6I3SB10_HELMO|nr:EAL domain-containing protein [Heliobacterium mobile]
MGPMDILEDWLKGRGQLDSKLVNYYSPAASMTEVLKQLEQILDDHESLGLVYLDIVNFTGIEQAYGFSLCKRILTELTKTILEVKPHLGVGRGMLTHNYSGDDFAVYCSLPQGEIGLVLDFLEEYAEELRRQILKQVNESLRGILRDPLDLHIGWAIVKPNSQLSLESLVYNAIKEALAMAKGHSDAKWTRRVWELKDTMAKGNFEVHYQPLVNLESGSLIGYEALARGPANSYFASPGILFPFAEKAGLLYQLERIIREKALKGCHNLDQDRLLFLNISPSVVKDPLFAKGYTRGLMALYGLSPYNVVFEITERTAIQDFTGFRKILQHYRDQGFRVAVDDAGAGYSSLQAIAELQPDFIKIDMSLIRDIDASPVKQALLETFVTFGEKIGAKIVAEGIETEKELRLLAQMGVHIGQGYYLGRPSLEKREPSPEGTQLLSTMKSRGRGETIHSLTVGHLVEECSSLPKEALTKEAMKYFQRHSDCNSIVILDGMRPVGLVMREKMYYHLGNQYGVALYSERPISLVMDQDPLIVDASMRLEKVSQMATSRPFQRLYDHIIVTDENRCLGVVTVRSLLDQMTKIQMEYALTANPLTGLPGNPRIEQDILRRLERQQLFNVIYVDLDNFKAFNDRYGFEWGDKAITLLARIITKNVQEMSCSDDLVAHIGGDDLIIITAGPFTRLCEKVIRDFDERIGDLYTQEDRRRGYIEAKDRGGHHCEYPIMTVSLAVVECWPGRFQHPFEIGEAAAEVKKRAKNYAGSVYVIDGERVRDLTVS